MSTIDKIIEILEQKHISQKDLTDYLGLDKSTFSSWKNGKSKSYVKYLRQISEYLNVTVDYLLGRTNTPQINGNYISTGNITGDNNANMNINTQKPEDNSEELDEMTAELTKRFNDLSFDKKLDVFNYMKKLSQ